MGRKNHKQQHKPDREERKAKELQDLKKEKERLEKQVARLRKQLAKTVKESEEAEDAAQEDDGIRFVPVLPVDEDADKRMAELRARQPLGTIRPIEEPECLHVLTVAIPGPTKVYTYCKACKKQLENKGGEK
jgi:alanyl-tRNA synthetase